MPQSCDHPLIQPLAPNSTISVVLYEPEIPGNTGTLMRLAACWEMPLMLIEPLGFVLSDRRFRRSVMDYGVDSLQRFVSWPDFCRKRALHGRLVAVTPHADSQRLDHMVFQPGDHLIMGSENAGLPQAIIDQCSAKVRIPMTSACRSMNLALAAAIVWSEALLQLAGFPKDSTEAAMPLTETASL